jgi:glycosyltransferase involved in cell wall biosynthesis
MSEFKLLIVGAFPPPGKIIYGGISKSCEILLQSPLKNRFEILTLDSSQISNPPPRFLIRGFLAIRRIFLLFIYINKHKPQTSLVFTSDGWSAIEKGLMIIICKFYGIKTLIFPRAGDLINQVSNSNLRLKLIRFLFGNSDIFLCQGQRWSDFAVNKLNIDQSRVKVIGNWTATDAHICIGRDRDYKTINNVPKLIFVGWLENFKGIFELLHACNNLKNKGIQFHLKFIGGGSAESSANEFVKNHNLNKYVSFCGWVQSSELNIHLVESDIFVLPSWSEGMPNAMIEAMAAGLAVIVTSVGVITDYIQNEQHALMVPPKNIDLLEKSLQRLILDEGLRADIGFKGHILAKTLFSVEANTTILGDIIEDLIKDG